MSLVMVMIINIKFLKMHFTVHQIKASMLFTAFHIKALIKPLI